MTKAVFDQLNGLWRVSELKSLETSYNAIEIANEDEIASYYKIRQQLDNLNKQLLSYIQKPQHLLPFLQPGRLVKVHTLRFPWNTWDVDYLDYCDWWSQHLSGCLCVMRASCANGQTHRGPVCDGDSRDPRNFVHPPWHGRKQFDAAFVKLLWPVFHQRKALARLRASLVVKSCFSSCSVHLPYFIWQFT